MIPDYFDYVRVPKGRVRCFFIHTFVSPSLHKLNQGLVVLSYGNQSRIFRNSRNPKFRRRVIDATGTGQERRFETQKNLK